MNSSICISARELFEKNPTTLPDQASKFSKATFWYYTRLSTADRILNSCSFRVGNLAEMNDLDESRLHIENQNHVFALCFCNSNKEKIPMWYLYSGIAGNGAALGLTPSKMIGLIRSIKTVKGMICKDPVAELVIGNDIELQYGWIFYRRQDSPENILYRNKWYSVDNSQQFEKNNYFLKAYPWEYEREFRIVFINHTNTEYDALSVSIPRELRDSVKVKLAPELSKEKLMKINNLNCIGRMPQFQPTYSNLSINMNLFHRNCKSLPEYLKKELTKNEPDIKPADLCDLIRSAGRCLL